MFSRRKNALSRERLKLLLKQHCEPANGIIRLKVPTSSPPPPQGFASSDPNSLCVRQASSVVKYRLAEQNFSHFFPDEPPQFPCSVKLEGRSSPVQVR